jgi:hypothetical protein
MIRTLIVCALGVLAFAAVFVLTFIAEAEGDNAKGWAAVAGLVAIVLASGAAIAGGWV